MESLNKDQVLRQLQAIINEIKFSFSDDKVKEMVVDDTFYQKYDHFLFSEKAKIQTHIKMQKIKVDTDERKD